MSTMPKWKHKRSKLSGQNQNVLMCSKKESRTFLFSPKTLNQNHDVLICSRTFSNQNWDFSVLSKNFESKPKHFDVFQNFVKQKRN